MKHRSAGSRWMSAFLAIAMCMGLLPGTAFAAQTGSTDASRTVFDALGFNTKAPEGYEQDESLAGTPYGKTYTTMAEVDELFTFEGKKQTENAKVASLYRSLYGHDDKTDSETDAFVELAKGSEAGPISLQVEGNFSRANQGQKKNVAFINANFTYIDTTDSALWSKVDSNKGALVNFDLGVMDPVSGQYDVFYRANQYSPKFETDQTILTYHQNNKNDDAPLYLGNAGDAAKKTHKVGGTVSTDVWTWEFGAAYMAQNYIELATGDFDGDSIDEIAVYIGETNNPRVEIWKLQEQDGDGYLNPGHYADHDFFGPASVDTGKRAWKIAWTYPLNQYGSGKVPNMVSLSAADYDKDGIDDLAVSWGYFGSGAIQPSRATIMMGADNNKMMTRRYSFDLKSGGTDIYRASFTAGDVDNDGYNELVMGGSLANSDRNSRYLAVYEWNGSGFSIVAEQNFKLFEEENGVRKWQNIKNDTAYYSMLFAPANVAVGKFYGIGESPCIYLDSIVIEYGSEGFDILDLMASDMFYPKGGQYYVEWGARAADTTGNGQDTLLTMSNAVANFDKANSVADYMQLAWASYYQNQYALSGICFRKSSDGYAADRVLSKTATYSAADSNFLNFASLSFSLPNTDNDTAILKYTGEHYYTYSDPEVLAVLASPPYYADLANDDDDSQMIESSTAYGTSKGSGGGTTHSNSFSVGVYTSWEKTWSMLGVELASAEAEFSINNTFTWETQKTSSLEYAVEYATMAGVDTVVLYSMPIETYVYEAQIPNGSGYDTQTMTVNIPYEPSIQTLSLEKYNTIYHTYKDILPDVSRALTHTVGEPGSYASGTSSLPGDRQQTLVYTGDPSTIGKGSQNTQTQSISMTSEEQNSFNYELEVETKAGAGMGGVKVGVTAGYSHGAGSVHITTAGSSYTATMNGLPSQADKYGYDFNWKLVGFLYQGKYPVVTYLVTSVKEPPLLPENFGANEEQTTTDRIALEWDYSGSAAGFVLYRYFQSPSASGYYKIGTVEAGEGTATGSGRHYTYTDTGLSPNTEYKYRIQTIGTAQPNTSIPSGAYTTYTKPNGGVPVVAVSSETLNALPDKVVWVAANITNQSELTGAQIYYQWQKQNAKGGWADVSGETENTLTFRYPNADAAGIYRCKVSALADQNLVTAYSPEVTVAYAQREAEITSLTLDQKTGKLTATVKGVGVDTIPAGTVSFKLGSGSAESVYRAQLDAKGTAAVTVNPANGVYKVTAEYSGSKVFLPASYEPETPQFYAKGIQANTEFIDANGTYTYGDTLRFIKYTVDANGSITERQEGYNSKNWKFPSDLVASPIFTSTHEKRFQNNRAGWATKAVMLEENSTSRMTGITVKRKDAEITGLTDWTVSAGEVDTPAKQSDLYDKIRSTLKMEGLISGWDKTPMFSIVPTDTAGNYASDISKPGVYTITVALRDTSINSITENYNYTMPTAKLIVTGDTYPVSAAVESGETTYGSVSVSSPAGAAQAAAGQTVIFRAVPNDGYEVAGWTLNGKEVENSAGQTTLTVVQTTKGAAAVVSFRAKQNTLTVTALPASPTVAGAAVQNAVEADSTYFQNGNPYSTGAEITFTPEAAEGWHFTGWEYHVSGQSPQYSSDKTFTVTMPDSSVQLYAKFERDTYKLTLGEHLTAYADGKSITDLDAITGDTEVTVKPATGYALAENAQWQVNGEEYTAEADSSCKFSITADTSVTAEVAAQKYTVTLNAVSPADSGTAEATQTGEVTGGTEVTFTAAPSRGCAFDKWTDENGKTVSTNASYTVTVGADLTLTPVFAAQTGKTVSISAENGGGISWSIDGVDSSEYEDTITLYSGETLKITATPNDGKMVAGWNVNSSYDGNDYSREKTFAYKDLEDSNTISVSFKALTYFTVAFADGIEAKADGESVTSGASVAAGSRMTFTYSNNADTSVRVIKWKNGDTEYPLTKQLVIDSLMSALDISVETGELSFFNVDVEGENFTHNITGIYEENGSYAAGSSVTIKLTPETDFRITEVNCPGADISQDEDSGIWTAVIERLDSNVTCKVTTESTAAPPTVTKFTVTFDADGGEVSPETMETDENGKLTALPTPTRSGYRFDGWFTAAGEKADENTAYPENTTLTAHWTKQESGGTGGGSSGGGGSSSGGSSGGGSTGGGTTTPVTPDPGTTAPENPTDNPSREPIAFTDIEGHWAKEYIDYASAHGLVSGTSSTTFSPDAPTTRAQLWTMLARQAGAELAGGETWYEKAQIWAKNSGVSDGSDPDGVITRAQMVTMLYRAAGSPEITGGSSFTDVPADSWYAKAVAWAAAKGITTGTGNGRFSPNEPCTRAQIAAFLYRSSRNS
nr:S-layer homology domain-containing protein [uncultured Agathobaculum sp.]